MHGAPVSSPSASAQLPLADRPSRQELVSNGQRTSSGRLPVQLQPSQVRRYLPTTSRVGTFDFYTHDPTDLQDQSLGCEPNPLPFFSASQGFLAELSLKPSNVFSIHDELEREGDSTVTFWEYVQRQSASTSQTSTSQKSELECLQSYFHDYPEKLERLRLAQVLVPWGGYFSQRNSPWLCSVITQLFMLLKPNDDGFIAVIRDWCFLTGACAGQWRELENELQEWQEVKNEVSGRYLKFQTRGWVCRQLQNLFPDSLSGERCDPQAPPANMLSYWQLGRIFSLVIAPPLTRKNLIEQLVRGQADPDRVSTNALMDAFLTEPKELLARSWTLLKNDYSAKTDLITLKGSLHHLCLQLVRDITCRWSHDRGFGKFDETCLVNAINERIGSIDDVLDCIAQYRQHAFGRWCVDPNGPEVVEVTAVCLTQLRKHLSHLKQPVKPFSSGVNCVPMATPCAAIADKPLNSADPARGIFYIATGDEVLEKSLEEMILQSSVTARELCNMGQSADISTPRELDSYLQYIANCIHFRPMYLGMKTIEFTACFSRSETHAAILTAVSQTLGYDLMHPLLTITPVPIYLLTDADRLRDFQLSDVPDEDVFWLPIKRSFHFVSDRGIKAIAQQVAQ